MKRTLKKIEKLLNFKILTVLLLAVGLAVPMAYAKKESKFVVVIDAGHGGFDKGAADPADSKAFENEIVLAIAKDLAKQIKDRVKNCDVKLTRTNDQNMTLKERVEIAKKMKGNLFISLHVNKSSSSDDVGFKAFVLDKESDEAGRIQAIRENMVISYQKDYQKDYGKFDPRKDDFTAYEMPAPLTSHYSEKFAELAGNKIAGTGRPVLPTSRGSFWTLSQVGMPGAVLELGFISNAEDRKFLKSKEGQKAIANSLCNAVVDYVYYYRTTDPSKINLTKEDPEDFDSANNVKIADAGEVQEFAHNPNTRTGRQSTSMRRKRRAKRVNAEEENSINTVQTATEEPEEIELPSVEQPVAEQPVKQEAKSTENRKQKKNDEDKGHKAKKQTVKEVYVILLYTSKELLDENNIAFKGYKPTSIHENNMYKYIYGEGKDKKELEPLLKEVKKRLPDAKIIKIRK